MTPSTLLTMSPALAAVLGSLAGATGSTVSTWITQRHADQRDLLARRIFHREQLYSDFISESTNILIDALESSFKEPHKLIPAYALLSRIRLSSSKEVLTSAEKLIREIIAVYSEPNLTAEQIRSRALGGKDPLKQFSDICRAELDTMRGRL
jgi:hypothetical protein